MSVLQRRKELICSIVGIRGSCLNCEMLSLRKLKVRSESWWTKIATTKGLLTLQAPEMVIQRGDKQMELSTMNFPMPPACLLRTWITSRSTGPVPAPQNIPVFLNPSVTLPIRISACHPCIQLKIPNWYKGLDPQPKGC